MVTAIQDYVPQFKHILQKHLSISGKVIYSSAKTVQQGDIYFLGINPGGTPHSDEPQNRIEASLNGLNQKTDHDFLDEACGQKAAGQSPLQKSIQRLFNGLGYDLREVCTSNLVFIRSREVKLLKKELQDLIKDCWPVHEILITEIVKPKVILSYGSNAYHFLFQRHYELFGVVPDFHGYGSGHGNTTCKWFQTEIQGHSVKVISIPHLSRFTLSDSAIEKTKNLINAPA
jgi:hypothetical protein